MRIAFGTRDVERELAIADSLIVAEERRPLEQLVRELRAASRPEEFHALQQALLERFYARQTVTDELKEQIAYTKAQLRTIATRRPVDRQAIVPVQQRLAAEEFAERCCKAVLHALRSVGDGIAWKALRYDRAAITVLGAGRRVGRLSDRDGLDAELAAAAGFWNEGRFAIYNDLTNCLRTGDLTLPFEGDGSVTIVEVKAGKNRDRVQADTASRKLSLLTAGRGSGVFGAGEAMIARYPIALDTHLDALAGAVSEARRHGYARAQPSPCLLLTAVDPRVSGGAPGIDVYDAQARAEAGWDEQVRDIRMLSLVRRMRDRLQQFAYLAPLTIYPLPARDIVELILGPLEFIVTLNASVLESMLAARGVVADVVTSGEELFTVFLRASKSDMSVELSALIREQVLSELLAPATLIDGLLRMLAGRGDVNTLVAFADEWRTWGGQPPRDLAPA